MISLERQRALQERLAAEEAGTRPRRRAPKFSDIKRRANGSTYITKEYISHDDLDEIIGKKAQQKAYKDRSNWHKEYDTMSELKNQHNIQDESVILARQFKYTKTDGEESTSRKFLYFTDYIALYEWYKNVPLDKRTYYECITGKRKPYFDIDLHISEYNAVYPDRSAERAGHDLVSRIVLKIHELIPDLSFSRDILIYTSHGGDILSYHLVVNNYYFENHKQADKFHDVVVAGLPPYVHPKAVDKSVYSSLRQMRLLGSHKVGSDRCKISNDRFRIRNTLYYHEYIKRDLSIKDHSSILGGDPNPNTYIRRSYYTSHPDEDIDGMGAKYLSMEELKESLIGFTSGCRYLTGYEDIPKPPITYIIPEELKDDVIRRVTEMIAGTPTLSIGEIKQNIVTLRNNGGYRCINCSRVHEHENPYIKYTTDSLQFICRR